MATGNIMHEHYGEPVPMVHTTGKAVQTLLPAQLIRIQLAVDALLDNDNMCGCCSKVKTKKAWRQCSH